MSDPTSTRRRLAVALGDEVRLAWTGAPPTGLLFRPIDAFSIPLSLLFATFAIFWETMVWTISSTPVVMRLFGIPFIVVGLFLVFGRFAVDAYLRAHTAYGIDERMAYVVRDGPFARTVAFNLASTVPIDVRAHGNGTGTIGFGARPVPWNGYQLWAIGSMREFESIPDVANVYKQVTAAAARS